MPFSCQSNWLFLNALLTLLTLSLSNARADAAMKAAAAALPLPSHMLSEVTPMPIASLADLTALTPDNDHKIWSQQGCTPIDGVWYHSSGPCLPSSLFSAFARLTLHPDHMSKQVMLDNVNKYWFTKGFTPVAEDFCHRCLVCLQNNLGHPKPLTQQAAHPPPNYPFNTL